MKHFDFETRRYTNAELMRIADAERAKYLRGFFKKLYARWTGSNAAPAPRLSGAKA